MRLVSRSLRPALAACALACGLAALPAAAGSASAFFQVTATVVSACAVTTPGTLAFGAYTPSSGAATSGSTNFSVTCTTGTPYSLGMSAGTGSGATVASRKLTSASAAVGNNTLHYGLFKDNAYSVNWDNSSSATGYVGAGSAQSYTVYGQIPAGQYSAAPANDYVDTVTLTLTY